MGKYFKKEGRCEFHVTNKSNNLIQVDLFPSISFSTWSLIFNSKGRHAHCKKIKESIYSPYIITAIDVKNYTTMTVYSIVNRANVYSGGDTTYISINDVAVKTTAQLQSMVHTIDVSNVNTVKLKVGLGWHAGNYGGINIYDIQFS